ncbi:hypothetical protein C8J56DRAFT_1167567 [Mycena floridula]|nr:hypothetical protein C8J56DRAFT_1167567 [Mycena floridula]
MGKGTYPSMTISDVINALSGWGLSVSVYCACLQQVTGITIDCLREATINQLQSCPPEEKDLRFDGSLRNKLVWHMQRFANAAKVEEFNANDLSSPTRERTLNLLAAFINFVKFTEQICEPVVRQLRESSEKALVEKEQVAQQLQELQHKIQTLKAKMAEDEPKCAVLRQENTTLRARMVATKDIQVSTVSEVEKFKAEKRALLAKKEALNAEINSLTENIARTRTRIVQSPERIKRTITTMSQTAIEDKKTVTLHESKARDLSAKINALLSIEKDVRSCIEQLQTIEKEVASLRENQKELGELKDHLDDKKIERTELTLRQERVQKQLANANEKLERAQRHAEDKKLASQKTIDRLQKEYDEMVVERRDNDQQVDELRTQSDAVAVQMSEHLKASETELDELLTEYWRLRHAADIYMETLANKLNIRVSAE